ncbi:hypothetical protein C0J52_10154 [Blattella germanica]|nr:hypothetical protein C0J52_10154 [Blattella germanica]
MSNNVFLLVTAGAAPVDANQRPSSAHSNARSSTSNKGNSGTLHWFAYVGNEADSLQNERVSPDTNLLDHGAESDDGETLDGTSSLDSITDPGKEPSGLSQKEREERIRALRDRQNEERQRKLEELKQQALAAQKFREQKEEERRRRIEELRQRDNDRRHQVEERKRQIWEAERDRREAILRKNQEREARIDSKRKNERSSIVFAFGSSTPRMLEPADTGGSFWGTRRATSTTNVMMLSAAPLTRRSSERELDGSKKRATSASGLDRKPGEDMKMSSSMYEVFHWNSTPEPTSKPTQRAKSLSYAPGSEPKTTPDKSDPHRTAPEVPTELNLNLDGRAHSFSSAPHTPSNRSVRIGNFLPGYGGFPGAAAAAVLQRVNRRKTDLMPTIPSPRDLTPTSSSRPSSVHLQGNRPFSRSPGRAYSMSRLDQLSQPRRRPAAELAALHEKTPTPNMLGSSPTTAKSMSRSMSHLASGGSGSRNTQRGSQLRRSDASRSMSQLSGSGQGQPVPLPRMTRAERLRQRAREMAVRNITGSTGQLQGSKRIGKPDDFSHGINPIVMFSSLTYIILDYNIYNSSYIFVSSDCWVFLLLFSDQWDYIPAVER